MVKLFEGQAHLASVIFGTTLDSWPILAQLNSPNDYVQIGTARLGKCESETGPELRQKIYKRMRLEYEN